MAESVRHYLLRLWREGKEREDGGGAWRASLRSVQDGSLLTFSEPEALLRFLNEPKSGEKKPAPG
jgi:hypothetical protein